MFGKDIAKGISMLTGILAPRQQLKILWSESQSQDAPSDTATIVKLLGGGRQGEVYECEVGTERKAIKWYLKDYLKDDPDLRSRLQAAMMRGAPNGSFLWPQAFVSAEDKASFGYLMDLREPRFHSIGDLLRRAARPTFRVLVTSAFNLVEGYKQLHSAGLCYRDISLGNAFFDPKSGDVLICDNDNVDINLREGGVAGTTQFMAPELILGKAKPSTETDLHSLAVLLFYFLYNHHPLQGEVEHNIHSLDRPAQELLYGEKPVYIFHPTDHSNRPVPGAQDNPLIFNRIYPSYLRGAFEKSFTKGLSDPLARVRETEWRRVLCQLRDHMVVCTKCGADSFFDVDEFKRSPGYVPHCWRCKSSIALPPRLQLDHGAKFVMLNASTELYPHHLDPSKPYDFSDPLGSMCQHPQDPKQWGLRNCSSNKWVVTSPEGTLRDVLPGSTAGLRDGLRLGFGTSSGIIRA